MLMISQEELDEFSIVPMSAAALIIVAPAIVTFQEHYSLPESIRFLSLFVMVGGVILTQYWVTQDESQLSDDDTAPDIFDVSDVESNEDLVLTEYEQLCQEIRYREKHAVNITYFSIAIQALIANQLISVGVFLRPLVSSIGLMITFIFWMGANGHWLGRGRLLERQKLIERQTRAEQPALYHTLRTERSPSWFDTLKIVDRVPELHFFMTLIWFSFYIFLMITTVAGLY